MKINDKGLSLSYEDCPLLHPRKYKPPTPMTLFLCLAGSQSQCTALLQYTLGMVYVLLSIAWASRHNKMT